MINLLESVQSYHKDNEGVMKKIKLSALTILTLFNQMVLPEPINLGIKINHIQFVGSHNSYKPSYARWFCEAVDESESRPIG